MARVEGMVRTTAVFPPAPGSAPSAGPAGLGLTSRTALLCLILRASGTAGASLVAVVGLAPPARPHWVLAAVAALLCWTVLFSVVLRRQGLRTWLFVGDALVVSVLCLYHDRLVPAEVLAASAGTGWLDMVAGTSVFVTQFGLRQPLGLLTGFTVVAAYAAGSPGAREAPVVMVLQALLALALIALLRRSARSTDLQLARQLSLRAADHARSAARVDELNQQRLLHDTVLATLTMISSGSIGRDSPALPRRVAADLEVIAGLRAPSEGVPGVAPARLDLALRSVVTAPRPGLPALDVTVTVPSALRLPRAVVVALSESVGEALTNVARYAGTTDVWLTAEGIGPGVQVEVRDGGRGFLVDQVPSHRRGLRESIRGRMRVVGGSGVVRSRPSEGTAVILRWPNECAAADATELTEADESSGSRRGDGPPRMRGGRRVP